MQEELKCEEVNQLCGLEPGVSLQPIWSALLDIYRAFDDLCRRYGLLHYVAYGTLLGAVRHKGFIPWDDDFDVMMPRPDYEKLITLRKELPNYLQWKSIETDERYGLLFGKIYEKRQDLILQVQKASGLALEQGLFIDVFPLDGLPTSSIGMQTWRVRRALRRRMCSRQHLQEWFKKWRYADSRFVGFANCEYSDVLRIRYPKETLGKPRRMEFDGIFVNAPIDPERILVLDYGDWQSLPPPEKRIPTHQKLPHNLKEAH